MSAENLRCSCGCVPDGMASLFQMAELRARHKKEEKKFECLLKGRFSEGESGSSLHMHQLNLRQLFLNPFTTIASKLQVLHLDHNDLESVPYGLFSLTVNIQDLALHNNALTAIPSDICRLKSLKTLRLDNNNLKELPESIGDCTNLAELHLDGNKSLAILPSSCGNLERLHHILMRDVVVVELPLTMYRCISLEFITFEEKYLLDPPPEVMNGGPDCIRAYLLEKYRRSPGETLCNDSSRIVISTSTSTSTTTARDPQTADGNGAHDVEISPL